jgi:hypothetical protein
LAVGLILMPLVLFVFVTADGEEAAFDGLSSTGEERSGGTINVAPAVHGFVEIVRDLVEVLIDPGVRIPGRTGFEVLVEVTNDAAECGFNLRVVSRWFPWQSRSILGVRRGGW